MNRSVRESAEKKRILSASLSMSILLFDTRDELIRVDLMHVVYFEADDNYTSVYFSNGAKVMLLCSLTKMEELIDEKEKVHHFIRVGKRYIVNQLCILQINTIKKKLVLTSFDAPQLYVLSVSKEALKNLKELYLGNE